MKTLMIAAMESGSGKTSVTCALLSLLRARGCRVQSCKCGPDYIDPMFHTAMTGAPARNLDLFLQGSAGVLDTWHRCRGDWVVIESAMGYYDGIGGTAEGSGWALAELTQTPVLLVLTPKGSALTLAAQVRGMLSFRAPSHIAGLLLNRCPEKLAAYLQPILTRETGLPVVGYLPDVEGARLPSRHLGLYPPAEIEDLRDKTALLVRQMEQNVDFDILTALAADRPEPPRAVLSPPPPRCRIAVAMDEAFCFYYQDSLDALERAGAQLRPFSPLRDPDPGEGIHGLYLGGGYPELYASALSENHPMRAWIRRAVGAGLPTVAECGGFLYLQRTLTDAQGQVYPMSGVLPGDGFPTPRLQRFGYLTLTAQSDSLLFRSGERIPAHEFHHWDTTDNGSGLLSEKPLRSGSWRCGFVGPTLYAAFPHLYLNGTLAARFVDAASRVQEAL